MTAAALRAAALRFAATLEIDSIIPDALVLTTLAPVWALIPALLFERTPRLYLKRTPVGYVVKQGTPWRGDNGDGIQATVVTPRPVDHTVKPVAIPMADNVFSDPDAVTRIQCRTCLHDWWRCGCRASMTVAKFDETTPMGRGGQA